MQRIEIAGKVFNARDIEWKTRGYIIGDARDYRTSFRSVIPLHRYQDIKIEHHSFRTSGYFSFSQNARAPYRREFCSSFRCILGV